MILCCLQSGDEATLNRAIERENESIEVLICPFEAENTVELLFAQFMDKVAIILSLSLSGFSFHELFINDVTKEFNSIMSDYQYK